MQLNRSVSPQAQTTLTSRIMVIKRENSFNCPDITQSRPYLAAAAVGAARKKHPGKAILAGKQKSPGSNRSKRAP